MDFGALLHKAQKNEKVVKKEPTRCYSTKFEPPKKEQRKKQQLSENIKKFLAKKEAEERLKKLEAHKRKEDLMALRAKDKKATRCMNVMLRRTKSANQSVLQDAIDINNTSVTLAGPHQPDEDDYGYVSQEAAAFYNKMMEKYSKIPDEPKFSLHKKKKISTDLNSTKERVKAALEREREEANMPHKRRRKQHKEDEVEDVLPPKQDQTVKKPRPAAPPPLNFNELLKLAEKKQFEPIVIEQKPKEEEKLFTKKQKKEMEREREWRDRKEGKLPPLPPPTTNNVKIQKAPHLIQKESDGKATKPIDDVPRKLHAAPESSRKVLTNKTTPAVPSNDYKPASGSKLNGLGEARNGRDLQNRKMPPKQADIRQRPLDRTKQQTQSDGRAKQFLPTDARIKQLPSDVKSKQFPLSYARPKQFPPSDGRPKQFPPNDLKRREFPPGDVRRREFPPNVKRKPGLNKRRILDDDEEYDSEMDDFIDDGPEDGEDYSKYINEIFGYDKSKYRQLEDDVDNMESSFAQQMREEVISTKIGIMEDLEDMRLEEEHKRRKAMLKKRM